MAFNSSTRGTGMNISEYNVSLAYFVSSQAVPEGLHRKTQSRQGGGAILHFLNLSISVLKIALPQIYVK